MKRAKGVLASLRLVESFLQTRISPARSLHLQVTRFSDFSPLFPSSLSKHSSFSSNFVITHKKAYFSSKPESVIDLITTNEWSADLEKELQKSNQTLTYETVMYILKSLEKTPKKALEFFNWVNVKNGFNPSSMVYSLMLRILANKQSLNEFREFIKKVEDEGCGVDERTHLILLRFFSDVVTNDIDKENMITAATDWSQFYRKITQESSKDVTVETVADMIVASDSTDEMKEKLGELKVSLSESTLLKIFWKIYGSPLKALCFFRWLSEHMGYTHNAVTYNAILRVLGQKVSIKKFWILVKELKGVGYEIDIDTYDKLARKLQRSGMMTDAVDLYELMMDGPYSPLVQDCSSLLRDIAMAETPDLDLVSRVVKKYEATGRTLSKEAYKRIYKSLVTVSKFDEAKKTLDTMKNAGFEPDCITYSQGAIGLRRAGRMEESMNLVEEMESKEHDLGLSNWYFLVRQYCKAGETDKALKSFRRMIDVNCKFDTQLSEDLVDCLCSNQRVDDAYTLVTDLVNRRPIVRPFLSSFQKVAEGLLREKKLEEAMNLLHLMKKHNYAAPRNVYVNYISKYGTLDDAMELLNGLIVEEYPSPASYVCLFEAFIKEGRQSEARDLFYKCPDHIRKRGYIVNLFASLEKKELRQATA